MDAAELWKEGRAEEGLAAAWAQNEQAPSPRLRATLAVMLREEPQLLTAARVDDFIALLKDPDIDPTQISKAGWEYLLRSDAEWTLDAVERSPLALALLTEDIVSNVDVELALTRLRRMLLFSPRRGDHPRLVAALLAQAALNEGAWPFDADERAALADNPDFAAAYLPPRAAIASAAYGDPVTRAVAQQYEGWPYPTWTRAMGGRQTTLAARVADMDPGGPPVPSPAEILIAGCGTGRQAAMAARRMPGERFTAIDLSAASLRYARERCAALGVGNVTFRQLDIYDVAALGQRFDAVLCTGVLHHLPDPEKGWAALADVLAPGGVMQIMVYSRIARLRVAAMRKALGGLMQRPIDDDLLREVRRRAMAFPAQIRPRGHDFHSLAGVHDLLLHRHEDLFDLPRIRRDIDALGLRFLRFQLPTQRAVNRYRALRPDDPKRHDFAGWSAMERDDVGLFAGMYDFWCRKPA